MVRLLIKMPYLQSKLNIRRVKLCYRLKYLIFSGTVAKARLATLDATKLTETIHVDRLTNAPATSSLWSMVNWAKVRMIKLLFTYHYIDYINSYRKCLSLKHLSKTLFQSNSKL